MGRLSNETLLEAMRRPEVMEGEGSDALTLPDGPVASPERGSTKD